MIDINSLPYSRTGILTFNYRFYYSSWTKARPEPNLGVLIVYNHGAKSPVDLEGTLYFGDAVTPIKLSVPYSTVSFRMVFNMPWVAGKYEPIIQYSINGEDTGFWRFGVQAAKTIESNVCSTCEGVGKVVVVEKCDCCEGTGDILNVEPCSKCGGDGTI